MSSVRRLGAVIPWCMAAASALVLALAVVLLAQQSSLAISDLLYGSALLSFAVVGAFVAHRRPDNAVGWLFAAVGLVGLAQFTSYQAAFAAYGPLELAVPGALWLAWFSGWAFPIVAGTFLVAIPLLFPTGRLPSRLARGVLVTAVLLVAAMSIAGMLRPGPIDETTAAPNPLGMDAAPWLGGVADFGFLGLGVLAILAVATMVSRYRRSDAVERLQLKWFAYAVALVVAYVVLSIIGEGVLGGDAPLIVDLIGPVVLAGLPISAGVAITRYRLYEIDRLVSRTVAYAIITAVLGGLYAGAVLLLGSVAGGGSDLAVAASTLLVAAAFGPVRRRVQTLVDRRFNRARYDAQRTVESFAARLRDEVQLDELSRELATIVQRTVAPANLSVWVREGAR